MRKVIIVTGHGNYATGLKSSIELLAGVNKDLYYIDFTVNDSDLTLKEKFEKVLEELTEAEVLFVCDILGGTPYKIAAEMANDRADMEVVVGCNIGSIVEVFFQKEELSIVELAETVVNLSKESTMKFNKIDISDIKECAFIEDGI